MIFPAEARARTLLSLSLSFSLSDDIYIETRKHFDEGSPLRPQLKREDKIIERIEK